MGELFPAGQGTGQRLTEEGLASLVAFAHRWFEPDDGVRIADERPGTAPVAIGAAREPSSARHPSRFGTATVSRTVGWGTAAAVAVGAWQAARP